MVNLRWVTTNLDHKRIPLNGSERGEKQGNIPYWGANGIVDYVDDYLVNEPVVLIGEDGAPFLDPLKEVAFQVDGPIWPNNHIHVLRPNREKVADGFLKHWLNTVPYAIYINGSTRDKLTQNQLGSIKIGLPSLETQKRIAAFLDGRTAQIDGLIEKKRRLLDRLSEKRQAIITQAVTKGLNPAAPMHASGIEWLGQIPTHWEAKRLKYISARVTVGIVVTPAAYYADEGILALRGLNVRTMGFDFSDTRDITLEGHQLNIKSMLRVGDLVAVRTGAPGTTAVMPEGLAGSNCIDLVIIRRPRSASEQYVGWFLNSDIARTQYALGAEGALQQHFNVETTKEVMVTLPPLSEQADIARHIGQAIAAHDAQTDKVRQSINKLAEYRTALITSAVTGQMEI